MIRGVLCPVCYEIRPDSGFASDRGYSYFPLNLWHEEGETKPAGELDEPSLIIVERDYRFELSSEDVNRFNYLNACLNEKVLPIFKSGGFRLKNYNEVTSKGQVGNLKRSIRWLIVANRDPLPAQSFFWLSMEGNFGRRAEPGPKKWYYSPRYVSFRVQLGAVGHCDHLKIPAQGVGQEFYLEDLFSALDKRDYNDLSFERWHDRLDWTCSKILEHKKLILNPLPLPLLERMFDRLRARAIPRERLVQC